MEPARRLPDGVRARRERFVLRHRTVRDLLRRHACWVARVVPRRARAGLVRHELDRAAARRRVQRPPRPLVVLARVGRADGDRRLVRSGGRLAAVGRTAARHAVRVHRRRRLRLRGHASGGGALFERARRFAPRLGDLHLPDRRPDRLRDRTARRGRAARAQQHRIADRVERARHRRRARRRRGDAVVRAQRRHHRAARYAARRRRREHRSHRRRLARREHRAAQSRRRSVRVLSAELAHVARFVAHSDRGCGHRISDGRRAGPVRRRCDRRPLRARARGDGRARRIGSAAAARAERPRRVRGRSAAASAACCSRCRARRASRSRRH